METHPGLRIPTDQLTPDALRGILEEFVTRDGTDAADAESKIQQVERLLRHGEVAIWFDEETRTCNVLPT